MINKKNTAVCAASGFAVSFLLSIISTRKILVSLLRGVIFAAVFAALYIAIDFLFKRFLAPEAVSGDAGAHTEKRSGPGSVVNITIDDEDLTDDGNSPEFKLTSSRGIFTNTNPQTAYVKESAASQSAGRGGAAAGYAPGDAGTPDENEDISSASGVGEGTGAPASGEAPFESDTASEREGFRAAESSAPEPGRKGAAAGTDDLSDMQDFSAGERLSAPLSASGTKREVNITQDTETIASAIRTMLRRDE